MSVNTVYPHLLRKKMHSHCESWRGRALPRERTIWPQLHRCSCRKWCGSGRTWLPHCRHPLTDQLGVREQWHWDGNLYVNETKRVMPCEAKNLTSATHSAPYISERGPPLQVWGKSWRADSKLLKLRFTSVPQSLFKRFIMYVLLAFFTIYI